jgi:hypothetical protein
MNDQEAEKAEKKSAFKVVDRRRFTDDGDERTGPDVAPDVPVRHDVQKAPPPGAPAPSPAAQKAAPPAAAPAPSAPGAAAPAADEALPPGLSFAVFLQSLAQQALMQLGLIPWPHGQRELALDQARDTIDVLTLLKVKTKGNLNAEEQGLMDNILHELKLSFVEVQQAIQRSRGGR